MLANSDMDTVYCKQSQWSSISNGNMMVMTWLKRNKNFSADRRILIQISCDSYCYTSIKYSVVIVNVKYNLIALMLSDFIVCQWTRLSSNVIKTVLHSVNLPISGTLLVINEWKIILILWFFGTVICPVYRKWPDSDALHNTY